MSFVSGLLLIDCPASALNNSGQAEDARTENTIAVKRINTKEGKYPYVSAQAFRYWWREALKNVSDWTSSPIFREGKIAYTDANPILYAEDDLFGYMRAPSKKSDAKKQREEQELLKNATEVEGTLTRQSPLKVSTLVSIAPLKEVTSDFGVMARHEGDPVPFEHEFYRTTLSGLFSVDLGMAGRFYHVNRTGFKHLDEVRINLAKEQKLKAFDDNKAFELSIEDRCKRIGALMQGLSQLVGGAKQSIHYTDLLPKFLILAVAKGGNHLFSTVVSADPKGLPVINTEALKETCKVYKDELISGIYIGLPQGYLDHQRQQLIEALREISDSEKYKKRKTFIGHPKEAIDSFVKDLGEECQIWLK